MNNTQHNFMTFTKSWLDNLQEINPQPTNVKPNIKKLEHVNAIIFDIYGTLLISASGDIHQAEISDSILKTALRVADYKFVEPGMEKDDKLISDLLASFVKLIQTHQGRLHEQGIPFPEVDIREVWGDFLAYAIEENILRKTPNSDPLKLTIIFELLSNRVWPMPNMKETINYLSAKGYPLGIVSNAQFYTPIMMNYFLSGNIVEGDIIENFIDNLSVFSFKLRKAKPDTAIFKPMLQSLKENYNILPGESVFIGNDMYKDIYPAKALGMKTVLFAGDKRSLRLREDIPEAAGLNPDAVITDLEQIKQIF